MDVSFADFVFLGRSHDAAAFHSSEIPSVFMQNPAKFFPTDGFIVGDSAYPLSHHLLVPYPESECIRNPIKREFNEMLSRSRVTIERAFGLLVARWRFLAFHLYILDQMDINDIISAACILHNICIDRGEEQFEIEDPATGNDSPDANIPATDVHLDATPEEIAALNTNTAGRQRRDALFVSIFGQQALQQQQQQGRGRGGRGRGSRGIRRGASRGRGGRGRSRRG